MDILSNLLISLVLGGSYLLGAIIYNAAPEEVDPFLKKNKIFKIMGKYLNYQAAILGVIFGVVLVNFPETISTFSLIIFLYALFSTSVASQRMKLKKALKNALPAFAIFSVISWIISLVL